MKRIALSAVAFVVCAALAAGDSAVQFDPSNPKAGDALFKMRATDGGQTVRNQYLPITPGAAMGWDSTGTPAALPMPTPFRITIGAPTATTPGTDGDMRMDGNYIYTFLAGSWSKTPRYNLTPQ